MEYVRVELKDENGKNVDRGVLIDDQESGRTNRVLMVQPGHHNVQLNDPSGYTPPVHIVRVRNTMPDEPLVVCFTLAPLSGRSE